VAGSARSLGKVKTGVAVRTGTTHPSVKTRAELHAAMSAAQGIYFPDPDKATAGIHFMNVLKALGLDETMRSKFRVFPNGATAMGEMAKSNESGLIGCTQVTEINYTEGVDLVDVLPAEFELSTDYTLGICTHAQNPAHAELLADLLTGAASAAVRKQGGFEF
jgi:molybdate transport system substrate-binding protein